MRTALMLLVALAAAPERVPGQDVARLRFDLVSGRLEIRVAGEAHTFALPAPDAGARVAAFREGLARDEWDPADAADLGQLLLAQASALLESQVVWEVSPLEVAPLGALVAPWSGPDPLVESTVICYTPAGSSGSDPSGSTPPDRPEHADRPSRTEGVLAVVPFHAGIPPAMDSPDTVLSALRPELRTLDLVPRNDTTPAAIAGSLLDHPYALIWLRARPEPARPLLPALSASPALLWWSRPGEASRDPRTRAVLEIASRWSSGGKSALVDLWPRPETQVAAGIRTLVRRLQDDQTVAEGLATARRELRANAGGAPRAWAGWILVGEGNQTIRLKEASWLQRIFRR